jgi:uridylate kinase
MSAIKINDVCEDYTPCRSAISKGVVIFAAGTGNPFFTTDWRALRAIEIGADLLLKATIDGPRQGPEEARRRRALHTTYDEVLARNLQVMDTAAFSWRGQRPTAAHLRHVPAEELLKIPWRIGTLVQGRSGDAR